MISKLLKGVEPGTIVVTSEAVDGMLRPEYRDVRKLIIDKNGV